MGCRAQRLPTERACVPLNWGASWGTGSGRDTLSWSMNEHTQPACSRGTGGQAFLSGTPRRAFLPLPNTLSR